MKAYVVRAKFTMEDDCFAVQARDYGYRGYHEHAFRFEKVIISCNCYTQ